MSMEVYANTTRRKVPIDADTCVKVVLILPRPAYTTYTSIR
jgi:hypothetical protein